MPYVFLLYKHHFNVMGNAVSNFNFFIVLFIWFTMF